MRIAFVGCGAAGRPLAASWRASGHEIGAVLARTSAEDAVEAIGAGRPNGSLDDADAVVFATPDDALAAVAGEHRLRGHQVALHLSGAHPSTILAPTGARTASLHPLRAFGGIDSVPPHTWFFVEGDAVEVAERLARDAGGKVARIATEEKTLYHAAAAIASNYTVTLLALARDLFTRAGVEPGLALEALCELAQGSIDNVARAGLPEGLTGPLARGDVKVIEDHLAALPERARAAYVALLEATIPIARAKGGLSPEAEAALRRLL